MEIERKFSLKIKLYLINRIIEETAAERLNKYNYTSRLRPDSKAIIGAELIEEPRTHYEQEISAAFSARCRIAFELTQTLKLIQNETIRAFAPSNIPGGGDAIWISRCVTTKAGRIYRRMPKFIQGLALSLTLLSQKFSNVLSRYKWLTGLISFTVLSAKVWHSGLIDKVWIGISAVTGLAVVFLLSLWR
ncbi:MULTISPECIES: hypothetical protein [unclassified Pseudomonas]|uniref:hypothetical protein n=1 Tax=unclassified Pseudomonas TaxID=196821 RepID=UPI00244C7B90|nr:MULTISPECIES: hypothetical protein [unclassified Pseudomonas]MDG9922420.1 hypothetical protein [Pseudomonas sp. GD04045]MDH0034382.1 hypothetical protein [Pseudomonas sp. GD04019]